MSAQTEFAALASMVETADERDSNLSEHQGVSEVSKADIICVPEAMAAQNENTPEVVNKIPAVDQNISPASAAIMQSLFYKEMMVKPIDVEDNSSNDSFESTLTNHDQDCSCRESSESDHDVSPLVNNEEGFKSFDLSDFVADDEANSKDATEKQDESSDDQDAEEDLPKEAVILNILSQLDPQAVNQVCQIITRNFYDENRTSIINNRWVWIFWCSF
jgi:hypothetical protein